MGGYGTRPDSAGFRSRLPARREPNPDESGRVPYPPSPPFGRLPRREEAHDGKSGGDAPPPGRGSGGDPPPPPRLPPPRLRRTAARPRRRGPRLPRLGGAAPRRRGCTLQHRAPAAPRRRGHGGDRRVARGPPAGAGVRAPPGALHGAPLPPRPPCRGGGGRLRTRSRTGGRPVQRGGRDPRHRRPRGRGGARRPLRHRPLLPGGRRQRIRGGGGPRGRPHPPGRPPPGRGPVLLLRGGGVRVPRQRRPRRERAPLWGAPPRALRPGHGRLRLVGAGEPGGPGALVDSLLLFRPRGLRPRPRQLRLRGPRQRLRGRRRGLRPRPSAGERQPHGVDLRRRVEERPRLLLEARPRGGPDHRHRGTPHGALPPLLGHPGPSRLRLPPPRHRGGRGGGDAPGGGAGRARGRGGPRPPGGGRGGGAGGSHPPAAPP